MLNVFGLYEKWRDRLILGSILGRADPGNRNRPGRLKSDLVNVVYADLVFADSQ